MPYRALFFFFTETPPPELYALSLHDALPILFARAVYLVRAIAHRLRVAVIVVVVADGHHLRVHACELERSEEHTSELQSRRDLVCRLLLEKKKNHETVPVA